MNIIGRVKINIKTIFGTINLPDGTESATIWTSGGSYSYNFALTSETFTGNWVGQLDLFADGLMNVTVGPSLLTLGDFYLASSTLVAHGDNGSAPVPEPGTMMLLGAGLLGLAVYGKRRMNK